MARFDGRLPTPNLGSAGRNGRLHAASPRMQSSDLQRMRILSSMVAVVSDQGAQSVTVARVVAHAGVSRKTFYDFFDDTGDCLREALERIVVVIAQRAREAYDTERPWAERVRGSLFAILEFFDEEPALARLCVIDSAAVGPAVLARRRDLLDRLAAAVDEGREVARGEPLPLAAQSVVGGAFAVIHARLLKADQTALVELLGPLMGFIVLPYLGAAAARRELNRLPIASRTRSEEPDSVPSPTVGLKMRLTYRTVTVLAVIAAQSGLSNVQVGERAGIRDQGQISKLLTRLARLELIENIGSGGRGTAKAWRLTGRGEALERATRDDRLTPLGSRDARDWRNS
jgi:AcrR family transcriptional regulator